MRSFRMNRYTATFATGLVILFSLESLPAESLSPYFTSHFQTLYGLSEDEAITRLASEAEANELAYLVDNLHLRSFAGSWFDENDWTLKVAVSDESDRTILDRIGAEAVIVRWSMNELQAAFDYLASLHASRTGTGAKIRAIAINPRANRIDLDVSIGARHLVIRELQHNDTLDVNMLNVTEISDLPQLTSDLLGATGIRNVNLSSSPCSIGVSVVQHSTDRQGFATAGHCGYAGHAMQDPNLDNLGLVTGSDWSQFSFGPRDGGWVHVTSDWQPIPEIYGYSHDNFPVPASRSGLLPSTIGTTVCRYGQTSGGGNWSCGTLDATNIQYDASADEDGSVLLHPMNRVNGSCSDDGDSGGPWVAASTHHIQGTNTAGRPPNTCPNQAERTYFYPMNETLNDYELTMLTSHGANPPSAYNLNCPDAANSGGGQFFCTSSFKSQGATSMSWSYGGNQFSGPSMFGTCSQGSNVSVALTISNQYGTDNQNISFSCPSGPIP